MGLDDLYFLAAQARDELTRRRELPMRARMVLGEETRNLMKQARIYIVQLEAALGEPLSSNTKADLEALLYELKQALQVKVKSA
jgi:hypothetical protein